MTAPTPTLPPGKYLTFKVDTSCYAFGIHDIREIILPMDIARVPRAQKWIRGVINLRGKIIPVMDLRARFELPALDTTERTVVIVVQRNFNGNDSIFGIQVDEVLDVLTVRAEQIAPPPDFGGGSDEGTRSILATARAGDRVVFVLDLERIVFELPTGAIPRHDA